MSKYVQSPLLMLCTSNRGNQSGDKKGLGVVKPHDLAQEDDEFDAYRKRMMLAYRFRPNPMVRILKTNKFATAAL